MKTKLWTSIVESQQIMAKHEKSNSNIKKIFEEVWILKKHLRELKMILSRDKESYLSQGNKHCYFS